MLNTKLTPCTRTDIDGNNMQSFNGIKAVWWRIGSRCSKKVCSCQYNLLSYLFIITVLLLASSKASGSYCDECNKPIYGRGLRLIRSNGQDQVFGYKCLPLIFQVCSPECHKTLKSCHEIIWNSDCKITP